MPESVLRGQCGAQRSRFLVDPAPYSNPYWIRLAVTVRLMCGWRASSDSGDGMVGGTSIRDNALYFPYINVPYTAWFSRILLYWDKVGSIVPTEYLNRPVELQPEMRELVEAGAVEQVTTMAYAHEIEELSESFISYVQGRLETLRQQPAARASLRKSKPVSLHIEKMGSISSELIGLGVAHEERYPWFTVDSWVANDFMFFLASMLGDLKEVNAVPVTNEDGFRSISSEVPNNLSSYSRQLAATRGTMLKALLPAPNHPVDVLDLLRFKARHGDLLLRFRRELEDESANVAELQDPTERARRVRSLNEKFEEQIEEITQAMRHRWADLALRKMLPILTPLAWPASVAAGHPQIAQEATTSASVLTAVVNALYQPPNFRDQKKQPLAYVAFARQAFSNSKKLTRRLDY